MQNFDPSLPLPLLVAALLAGCAVMPAASDAQSDAPQARVIVDAPVTRYGSYAAALAGWRRVEDINAWDLARFGVESLRQVAPELKPGYLMIEFNPTSISGQTLRRHWVVAFERDGGLHVFADSKRPGVMTGPYPTVQAFIAEYARFRGREIVAYRELDGYRKQLKTATQRKRGSA